MPFTLRVRGKTPEGVLRLSHVEVPVLPRARPCAVVVPRHADALPARGVTEHGLLAGVGEEVDQRPAGVRVVLFGTERVRVGDGPLATVAGGENLALAAGVGLVLGANGEHVSSL